MRKNGALALILFAGLCAAQPAAAAGKPVYQWVSANEYYFILPAPLDLRLPGNGDKEIVHPWGAGFRAVGDGAFSKTAALQFQSFRVENPATGRSTVYLFDLLLGMEYMAPKTQGRPLRFTASAAADLGMSDITLYAAPVISAGLLYAAGEYAETPAGLTFGIFYRPIDIDLDNAGNGAKGVMKPAFGVRLGYIFEGFWSAKEK